MAEESFKKTIELDVKGLDKINSQFEESNKRLEKYQQMFKKGIFTNPDDLKRLQEYEKTMQEIAKIKLFGGDEEELKKLEEKLKDLKVDDEDGAWEDEEEQSVWGKAKDQAKQQAFNKMIGGIEDGFKKMIGSLTDLIKEAWEKLTNMTAWSSDSYKYNKERTDLMLQYGITDDSQAYGFSEAMKEMNVGSQEDFMYLSDKQRERFAELQARYTGEYIEALESGVIEEMANFEKEWKDLKDEFLEKAMKWIIDNKDLIFNVLEMAMGFMQFVMTCLGGIFDALTADYERTDEERAADRERLVGDSGVGNIITVNNSISTESGSLSAKEQIDRAGDVTGDQVTKALQNVSM